MANEIWKNPIAAMRIKWIQHYNGVKYWKRRAVVSQTIRLTCPIRMHSPISRRCDDGYQHLRNQTIDSCMPHLAQRYS